MRDYAVLRFKEIIEQLSRVSEKEREQIVAALVILLGIKDKKIFVPPELFSTVENPPKQK